MPKLTSRAAVRAQVLRNGVKLLKIAEKAGVRPATISESLARGTSNVRVIHAILWGLNIEGPTYVLEDVACLWEREREEVGRDS